ncbi:MAG: hypothetical protein GEV07_08445 [Streptosporangiales bacterium]|nr:hypothetical protein [Streptosporangiales bacterium]
MADELFLVVDAGTTGTKVGAVDTAGTIVAAAYRGYPCSYPQPGWVEQSVDELWAAECAAIAEVVAAVDASRVAAIACSSQRATVVPVRADGTALTPYLGWQDQRGVPYCTELEERVGAAKYYELTGMAIDSVASLSKIRWLREHRADLAADLSCFAAHQTVLLHQLGVADHLVSPSEASYLGLMDVRTRQWHEGLAAEVDVSVGQLPTVVESGQVVGRVGSAAAAATGLREGLPIVLGGGDLQLGALGVGAAEGVVAVGIGTGGHCVAVAGEPRLDPGRRLSCLAHVVPGQWELEGLGRASGGTFRWFKDQFGDLESALQRRSHTDAYQLLFDEMPTGPGGARGIVVVPSWAGLGAPVNDDGFPGMVLGLRLEHDRGAVIRAFVDGITFEQRMILDVVREVVDQVDEIRAWGGAAKADKWCQIEADVFGVPVVRTGQPDASVVGGAVCAAVAVGAVPDFVEGSRTMVQPAASFSPDAAAVAAYERYYDVYGRAIDALRSAGIGDALRDLPRP